MFTVLTIDRKWYGKLLFWTKPKVYLCGDKNGCFYKVVSPREYTYKDFKEIKKLCGVSFNRIVVAEGVEVLPEYERYIAKPYLLKCYLATSLAIKFLAHSDGKKVVFCDKGGRYLDLAYKVAIHSSSMQVVTDNAYPYYKLKERMLSEEGIVLTVLDREIERGDCAIDLDGLSKLSTKTVFGAGGERNIVPSSIDCDDYKSLYIDGVDDYFLLQALFEWGNAKKLGSAFVKYFKYKGKEYTTAEIKLLT